MLNRIIKSTLIASSLTLLAGCNVLYDTAGMGMTQFGKDRMLPYFMATDDPDVGCAMGESMSPVLGAFGDSTEQFNSLTALASGLCADLRAKEAELRYLRAMKSNLPAEAADARTQQKHYLSLAAKRQYAGYKSNEKIYGQTGKSCPAFDSDASQLFWMMGMLNGVQAMVADVASETRVGVPMDVLPNILESMQCIDSEKWWGLPEGIEAMAMIMMPGEEPEGVDPEKQLQHAVDVGLFQGVRIVQALQANLYMMRGETEKVKQVIRDNVKERSQVVPTDDIRFIDAIASLQIQMISDRLWTEAVGQRTPYGKLGTFWNDSTGIEATAMDMDQLL